MFWPGASQMDGSSSLLTLPLGLASGGLFCYSGMVSLSKSTPGERLSVYLCGDDRSPSMGRLNDMIGISVSDNIKDVTRSLRTVERKQLPFVIAGALNATAFDAQRAVKKNLFKKFILRNKWTERGVIVIKATKREQTAWVRMARWYMEEHEEGGTRRAVGGGSLAIPMGARKNKRRRVTKAKRPRALLDRADTFMIRRGESSRLPPGIYQRMRGNKVKLMYALEPEIKIKPRLGMERTVIGVTRSRFFYHFNRAMARALR